MFFGGRAPPPPAIAPGVQQRCARVTRRWRAGYLAAERGTAADPAAAELGGR